MPNIELIHDDCMNVMAKYPDKHFDLAICDPPYGIGAGNGTGRSIRVAIERGKIKGGEWDSEMPPDAFFSQLQRLSGNQIIWGGNYFAGILGAFKSFVVWDKGETMYNRDFAECELAWTSFDRPAKLYKKSPNQADRIHPTQKPVALYRWLLHNYAKQGDKILDTHLGSGSSAIAAHQMGFDFVGCEIDKDYYDAACKRFKEQTMQQSLFKP